jgi:hypothetical protein
MTARLIIAGTRREITATTGSSFHKGTALISLAMNCYNTSKMSTNENQ